MKGWRDGEMERWRDGVVRDKVTSSNSKKFDFLLCVCAGHFLFFRGFVVLQRSAGLLQ